MRLIQPTPELHVQFLEALDEWGEGLHEDGFGLTEDDDVRSPEGFRAWIERLTHDKTRHWWITHDDDTNEPSRILGAIALRPTPMNGSVLVGHIGYGVTPSARGTGVATAALRLVLDRAAAAGFADCVLVCLEDNRASRKTIERCGGQWHHAERGDDGLWRCVYRIPTSPADSTDHQPLP